MTRWLRTAAVAIAVAGAVDPAWLTSRPIKPEIALVSSARLPAAALTDRVAAALESRFRVLRGPAFGASATVLVGDSLPADARNPTPVAFAIQPVATSPFVSILDVSVPRRGQLQSRVPVRVVFRAQAAQGRDVVIAAKHQGVVIDSVTRKIGGADVTQTIDLGFVATETGRTPITVSADIAGVDQGHTVDAVFDSGNERYTVLTFDRRPSWMSTFVRRSLEGDPRFAVTSRVATSRSVATTAGEPPAALTSLPSLELFNVVIVGAATELTAADATGLEAFMRRGGSVLLLLDESVSSPFIDRLTGVTRWKAASHAQPSGTPRASELFLPAAMPSWAEPAVPVVPAEPEVPVWSMPVGSGRLIVSGVLDSWRFRDSSDSSAFDRFWRHAVSAAADRPSAGLSDLGAETGRRPVPDERVLIRAWTSAHRGRVVSEPQLEELPGSLERLLVPPSDVVTLHPMRSGWWIAPFGLLLGIEWWVRRRGGRT